MFNEKHPDISSFINDEDPANTYYGFNAGDSRHTTITIDTSDPESCYVKDVIWRGAA